MRLLDTLLGRSKPIPPNLDQLFRLPSAAVTLEASAGFLPTGAGSVSFKASEGSGFSDLRKRVEQLLTLDGRRLRSETDAFGFTWLVRTTIPDDLDGLVTDLHAANTSLVDAGFGASLLCTLVGFTDGQRPLGLVYLYKRGTWYPFAPSGPNQRDTSLELQVRSLLEQELRMEADLARWFPVYGAPGL